MKEMLILAACMLSQQCFSQPIGKLMVKMYSTDPASMGANSSLNIYDQIMRFMSSSKSVSDFALLLVKGLLNKSATDAKTMAGSWNDVQFLDNSHISSKHDDQLMDSETPQTNRLRRKLKPEINNIPVASQINQPVLRNHKDGVIKNLNFQDESRDDKKSQNNDFYSSYLPIVAQTRKPVIRNHKNRDLHYNNNFEPVAAQSSKTALRNPQHEDRDYKLELKKEIVDPNEGTLDYILQFIGGVIEMISGHSG